MSETVQQFVRNQKGVNNIGIVDASGNVLSNSYDSYNGFTDYYNSTVKDYSIEDRANYGYVAKLVV